MAENLGVLLDPRDDAEEAKIDQLFSVTGDIETGSSDCALTGRPGRIRLAEVAFAFAARQRSAPTEPKCCATVAIVAVDDPFATF
jgi:hypothetical protein